ncbi:RagB/SusD family nutrient uptake outer membrane protein [Chitinophaga barathri]|uniref:RagB/SusD family nutrient uptake outer membrane protein n=1 Tax=Chitinophaga barathri TaxID=1647451 RepID=A0A3N4MG86_9BACT|nr:RagB/SusD family nutrient uptake outer membrane protein [Chitinophaga barathri]RPD38669.1 RagB/SusD family nutrient uptake outer membrane protein [Chitinophaga barathri]
MKYILYSFLILSTGAISCNKFLDKTPTDFPLPKNYFKTENDVNTALSGIYDPLGKTGTYGRTLFFELDMSDEGFNALSTTTIDLSINNFNSSDTKVNTLWNLLYQGINRANVFLENIDNADVEMDEAKRKAAKGQALFLRAYYYFMLVSNWGDVPVRLESIKNVNDVSRARTASSEIYAFIVKDMEAAADLVNPISAYTYNSRITKSVVWGILARVNLKMAGYPLNDATRWAEARKWAFKAMEPANGHTLNPNYAQIFINQCQDKYDTKEVLWEVEFNKVNNGSQDEEGSVGSINGIGSSDRSMYSYGAVHITERYYRAFGAGDLRRDWTSNAYYYGTVGGVVNSKIPYPATSIYNRCNAKWRREYETALPKNINTSSINFPVLRYSDVLLMFAEADNEVSGPTAEAYEAVNKVRRRAYGLLLPTPPDPAADADLADGLDQVSFRDAVRKERSLELGFEAIRRHDLIRWGIYITTMKDLANEITTTAPAAYKYASRHGDNLGQRHLLLPIPSSEMAINKALVQNPEW